MLPRRLDLSKMQDTWAQAIDPVLDNELVKGRLIQNQQLINGITTIDHKLGRKLIGWFLVGLDADANIFDSQASNQTPTLTLVLNSNVAVTCSLWVF